ncbi:hypothetical protein [Streptomyces cinereospinus]|uniref:Secreted protein n=1 Tax=Streptomyces cinereospinus TaxID=285561 RepID=A0ABV5MUQ9_9ACTN
MRNKTSALLLASAMAAGSVLLSAPAASAAAYCSSDGYTVTGLPIERCTTLSNGVLVHKKDYNNPTRIWTTYDKTGGSTVSVRLGYTLSGGTTYSGYFSISSGQTVQRSWSRSGAFMCYSSTGLLDYSGGHFQTPAAHC